MKTAAGVDAPGLASRLADALPEWVEVLGAEAVVQDADALRACETATFATWQKVLSMLRPANADEVRRCVVVANRHAVPLYAVSRGRNWGLGSRVPRRDAVVMDLSRLCQIAAYDETFGTIRLGPGATFQDVHVFLTKSGSQWFLPTIGGPPDASVVANFLERGDGSGPQADRLANIVSMQVILPSGERIETGYERFGMATPLAALSSEPAGPALNGLFTQSSFGIVTEATLVLSRRPKHLQLCLMQVPPSGLAALVDALQPLAMDLQACSEISLWNGHKIKARERVTDLAEDSWFCTAALYAPSALMAQAQREHLLDLLRDVDARIEVFDKDTLPEFEESSGIFVGVPSDRNIASVYAGKNVVPTSPLDPERDRCGILWLCPEVPLRGETVARIVELCQRILQLFAYAPILGMSVSRGRTVRLFVSIFYDRDTVGEDTRAMECHDMLQALLRAEGCLPFRLGLASIDSLTEMETSTHRFLEALSDRVDPNGILAPKKHFRELSETEIRDFKLD